MYWTLTLSDEQALFLRTLLEMALQDGEWSQADIPELASDPAGQRETELTHELLGMLEPGGA